MEALQAGFRGILRLFFAAIIIIAFLVAAIIIKIRHRRDVIARRKAFSLNATLHCGLMVRLFNIEVTIKGTPVQNTNFLYVGNHMGFVDIFVLSSVMPALFITSQEMRETPFLGLLCEMAGCIFVERRSRTQIMNELGTLKEALEQGFNVVLYPEATSTNGEAVLPFKKTLMMAGPHAGRPIQTACINFTEIGGEDFNLSSRDNVCWYGEMSFVESLWNLLTTSSIKAHLEYLEPIHEHKDADRGMVAEKAHAIVSARFIKPRIVASDEELAAAD
ncbi:lysophospholipid acyltransferase family protein [Bdellovibrio sp. HCB337]|uniref:lysophospholipid acyltransferase family protein n=1 Tax=Bdellovibrio sp. HCB337 TaxID=3394358 RepID=UPI0039A4BFEB